MTYQTAVKKDMGLLEAEIKKIVAHNRDTLVMPPPVPTDPVTSSHPELEP